MLLGEDDDEVEEAEDHFVKVEGGAGVAEGGVVLQDEEFDDFGGGETDGEEEDGLTIDLDGEPEAAQEEAGGEEEDEDEADVDDYGRADEEDRVPLDKLPRPYADLNCRMLRCYLTRLLRAANGGHNPAYGVSETRPPFWPQRYWPWERLTDVHTRPAGMRPPLNYSMMMRLAVKRGYTYFGYDPAEYVDRGVDLSERKGPPVAPPPAPGETASSSPTSVPRRSQAQHQQGIRVPQVLGEVRRRNQKFCPVFRCCWMMYYHSFFPFLLSCCYCYCYWLLL